MAGFRRRTPATAWSFNGVKPSWILGNRFSLRQPARSAGDRQQPDHNRPTDARSPSTGDPGELLTGKPARPDRRHSTPNRRRSRSSDRSPRHPLLAGHFPARRFLYNMRHTQQVRVKDNFFPVVIILSVFLLTRCRTCTTLAPMYVVITITPPNALSRGVKHGRKERK